MLFFNSCKKPLLKNIISRSNRELSHETKIQLLAISDNYCRIICNIQFNNDIIIILALDWSIISKINNKVNYDNRFGNFGAISMDIMLLL